ncbi:Hypothetical protein GL50581_3675 [Giardia duodenalis ATCC 50581]|uniref:Uncharacterized protein n=1 Tax=Giardia intestinalis (strain ATCC 50581 / GS clone H7) TaxID=598745 RepID=C6LY04_GIAIB|nr:Hypothetical protein GL50581_3675 [Giardia intestinalis ATCC 50581]
MKNISSFIICSTKNCFAVKLKMEVEIFDRFAGVLTTLRHESGNITPKIIKDVYGLLDYALANRMYKFVVDSTWGPLSSVVHNYIMIRAEKNKQTIEPMAYKLAFSFFFKQGAYQYAAGAMMRLATLCIEQASILASDNDTADVEKANTQLEDEVRNLILESQRALATAANIACVLSHASYFTQQNISPDFILGARWGVSKQSQHFLAKSILQDAHTANINRHEAEVILDNFHLFQQDEFEWTVGQIRREFVRISAMADLSSPNRRGYIASDGISILAASINQTSCCCRPSQVLQLSITQILDYLSRRGDIETALSICKAFSTGPNIVIQTILNHMVLLLDSMINIKDDAQSYFMNTFFQIKHLLTTTTVHTYKIKSVEQCLETQLKQQNITNNEIKEIRERFLCELETCRAILYDILGYFSDENGFLLPEFCNNCDHIFCSSNLFAEILISALVASRKHNPKGETHLSSNPVELFKLLNLVLDGLIERVSYEHKDLFELYIERLGLVNEFKVQLSKLSMGRPTDENRVIFA